MKVRDIAMSAVFVALITLATMYFRILPLPSGYVHLGDAFIFLACFMLRPRFAIPVSGIGSAMADLLGYPMYAPITLLVKCAMSAVVCFAIYAKPTLLREILSALAGSLLMLAGYFVFNILYFGWEPAIASVAFDWIQPAACGAIGIAVIEVLKRIPSVMIRRK